MGRAVPPISLLAEGDTFVELEDKRPAIRNLLNRYLPSQEAAHLIKQCEQAVHIGDTHHVSVPKLAELYGEVERLLAGSIGTATAHRASRTGLPYTPEEWHELSAIYGRILADLKVSPEELRQRVNYYQERAVLVSVHAQELQDSVAELERVQSELRLAHDELEKPGASPHPGAEPEQPEAARGDRRPPPGRGGAGAVQRGTQTVRLHRLARPAGATAHGGQLCAGDRVTVQGEAGGRGGPGAGFAVDAAKRMRLLINDLLAYARVGGHVQTLDQIDTRQVVDMATENLRQALEESHGHITCGPLPTVLGDSTQLTQVFQNLIDNAIKFRGERTPEVRIGAELTQGEWVFSVADNGIGIEPKYQDRIFRVFQRLNARSSYPGTGIGLALCKKVVEWHGGRIWVESRVGEGSTFRFTIPQRGAGKAGRRHMHGSIAFITVAVIDVLLVPGAGVAGAQTPAKPAGPSAGSTTAAAPETVPPVLRPYGIIRPAMVFGNGLESFGFSNFVAPHRRRQPGVQRSPRRRGHELPGDAESFRRGHRRTLPGSGHAGDRLRPLRSVVPDHRRLPPGAPGVLRVAAREGHRLLVGQTWDLFAPLNTPSFDLVANMYLAGNAGFMRPQAMYVRTTDRFEYGAALGLQGPNNAATLSSVEYSIAPTVAGRAGLRWAKQGSLVASGIGTRIRLGEPPAMRLWRWPTAARCRANGRWALSTFAPRVTPGPISATWAC
jgi:signal transduction histidine kinase